MIKAHQVARELGGIIAKRRYVLVIRACSGLPQVAVKGAREQGGTVIGISPALNLEEHVQKYHSPTRLFDVILYTGSRDVVISAGGRLGTLGEFAIAFDEAKVIGILQGAGGATEHLKEIINMIKKDTGA